MADIKRLSKSFRVFQHSFLCKLAQYALIDTLVRSNSVNLIRHFHVISFAHSKSTFFHGFLKVTHLIIRQYAHSFVQYFVFIASV